MDRRSMLISSALTAVAVATRALPQNSDSSKLLNDLFDQFMKENLDISPTFATSLGMDNGARAKQKSEIDDGSEKGIEEQKALIASQLKRLSAFDRGSLSAPDKISYDVVIYGLRTNDQANKEFKWGPGGAGNPYVISQLNGTYQGVPSFLDNQHTIENKADADAYIARLSAFATAMDQESEVARHDLAMDVMPPDFALAKTMEQMKALRAPAPDKSQLTNSVVRRTKEKGIAGDYEQQASRIVQSQIYPALERQMAVVEAMQKKAPHDAGVWRLPDGEAYYAASLQFWTTTRRTPAEVHQLGLEQVKEHTARIDALMQKLGMTQGTVGQRLRAMYKDPKFQYANTDAAKETLLADLNTRVQRVEAKLPQYFGARPKAHVEIKRVPKEIEAGAPGGYYNPPSLDGKRPGIYWINLRDTSEQPKWTLPTLTYHESIPGHHLQGSIQQEAHLPLIRKTAFFSAYMEGWALYAEQLAAEMGEYDDDPAGHIGQLHASMFRAVRLVVDTGMHSKRWSREQALRYFSDTLGDPETASVTEIERYSVWPGQACTYMLGKLTFLSQRARAQQTLGSGYDIHKFHDSVLLSGAVPLDLLEKVYT
jgi:uncharacterized protein (DUF885 family)